ncbi:AAA family ATPase [Solirubrobacter ginsenosidimutans]|uniref:AAA family ATPase n=1 Tax=Solirubrobacter ginsenosidimutans TaxID=490573 RepID=A0A9X3S3T3_9ACTN|nr:LuxR family transcriptional regulator [Solirubrobacter ginsenosidimutans]MDA0159883.1 AAA family ATPase [Solirubrobacter ginsenosidimutans]
MTGSRSPAEVPRPRGRTDELAALAGLLEGARAGRSGVLVLRGEAGIGKTALLEYTSESASDFTLLRAMGVESEMELPYAALHLLCAPVLGFVDRLPGPQRDALEVTFGVTSGGAPDRFLVALATLSLFSEAAQERPLLCIVDDGQWLDRASAQVLGFVARRLLADPVVLLFAVRQTTDALAGLPELLIEGLDDADASKLLASAIAGRLDDRVAEQLVAEAHGNPLALLELPRGLSLAQLAGGFGLPDVLSLADGLEQSFQQRLEALPENAQRLLLVAAAEPLGDPALVWRAAERLGITRAAQEQAESAGLIEIDGRVRFRHPLVRSAAYRAGSAEQRREVHRALAEATDAETDPDRRAWHLAAATGGTDESVAGELERAAGRAQARGGVAAAAAFLQRAAALTTDRVLRAQRALAAAQAKYESGAFDDALALLAAAEAGGVDDLQRARVHLLRAQITFVATRGRDAPPLLLKAARELEAVDPERARTTYLEALEAARFAGPLAHGADVVEVSEAALAGPAAHRPPRPTDLLLEGMATLPIDGHARAVPILKAALRAFRDDRTLTPEESRWFSFACRAAWDVWDEESWRLLATRELTRARDAGALTLTPLVLTSLSYLHVLCGELSAAESLLGEIRAITAATGIPAHRYVEIWLAALRGREPELSALVEDFTADAKARGEGFALAFAALASAVLYNGLGRYEEAFAAVCEAVDVAPYSELSTPSAVAELVEAAARAGERRAAERALERLVLSTGPSGGDWALGVEARSRALLSDGADAERLYQEAIERLRRTRVRVQLARTHLLYGEWLRRERRRLDARDQLRTALELFTSMGAEAFAARAERELLATGEHVRQRQVETRDQLTSQEIHIAQLALDGLSNREIGARLIISQHTVAYHLRKVFTKLGITSRNQLNRVLPQIPDPAPLA